MKFGYKKENNSWGLLRVFLNFIYNQILKINNRSTKVICELTLNEPKRLETSK